jgi:hypothetical protein
MNMFESFVPKTLNKEITVSEVTLLEELVALSNSPVGYFIRKENGSFVNSNDFVGVFAPALTDDQNYISDEQLSALHGVNATNTTSNTYADGKVADAINDGTTTIAPSQNAVFDALALKVDKATYDAQTILQATTDNTPVALTVGEQTVVGRATGGNIVALAIDSDLSAVSASDDTIPSAKATKAMGDLKLPLAGGTMTGKVTSAGRDEVGKTYTPATGAQTVTIDCSVNNMHIVTGHADGTAITFAITGATNSQPFIVSILQGGTTVSTITAWFATCKWAGGTAPTLTATLNKRDTFGFIRTGSNTYDGFVIGANA